MTTKPLLFAIMAILPITANAEYTYNTVDTPVQVASNGTVTIAYSGPYQTITPGANDDKHIASTKYVIGAYNDAIAAINTMAINKQDVFYSGEAGEDGDKVSSDLMSSEDFIDNIIENNEEELTRTLVTAYGVMKGIQSQRVEVYTNWDDDDATTDVAFKTVVPE